MKKSIYVLYVFLISIFLINFTQFIPYSHANKAYYKTGNIGGTSDDLDSVDGTNLSENDVGLVIQNGVLTFYILDEDSGETEKLRKIIQPDTNAGTKRWVLQENSPIENVKFFGAVGDGVTEDTPAFILAAAASPIIYVPYIASGYVVSGWTITTPVILYSDHPVVIKTDDSSIPVTVSSTSFKSINIIFDGNDTATQAFLATGLTKGDFEGSQFIDATDQGAKITTSTDVNITKCRASGNGDGDFTDGGIYVQGTRISLTENKSYDNDGSGFVIMSSKAAKTEDVTFTDNKAISNECHGFLSEVVARTDLDTSLTVDGRAKRVKFIGNTAISNGRVNPDPGIDQGQCSGFTGHYSRDSIWTDNTAYGNFEHGFVLMDGVDNIWVGNNSNYNGLAGFRIQGHTGVAEDTHTGERRTLMIGNAANKNGQDSTLTGSPGVLSALWIQANVQDLICRNNVLQDSVGYGLSMSLSSGYTGSFNLFFDGNIITGNDTADYLLNYTEDRIYGQFFGNDANGALREREIQNRIDKTANFTVPSTVSKRHYTNSGSTANITATLPNIQADSGIFHYDQEITLTNATSSYLFTITPDGSDKIISLTHTIGDSIILRNQGDSVTLKSLGGAGWYIIAQTLGTTMNQFQEFTRSLAYTMTEWRSGQTVFADNTGAIIFTLPTLSGQILENTYVQGTANAITLTPDSGAKFLGLCDADGDSIQSGAIGSSVTLRSTVSGDWIVKAIYLTWTDIN